jgi:hypothetical protein
MRPLAISFCLLIVFFYCIDSIAQTTIPGGTNVSGTWTKAGSPYLIEGEITVPDGKSLIIENGVRVEMKGWYKFNVLGHFEARGRQGDSIVFTTFHPDSTWHGLRFDNPDDTVKLQYVKIENGYANLFGAGLTANENGGGIYGTWGKYLIDHCIIQKNQAKSGGGGCYFEYAFVQITNSSLVRNKSKYGGGIIMQYDGNCRLVLKNSLVKQNTAVWYGGGIYCNYTPCAIYDCDISGNTAVWGGGIYYGYLHSELMLISNSLISKNTAERGSGIYAQGNYSKGIYTNSTFVDNNATQSFFGQTITTNNNNAETILHNCLITDNQNDKCLSTTAHVSVINSIIRDNGNIIDNNQLNYYNFNYSNTDTDFGGTGNINSNPQFINSGSGDYRLAPASPCKNTGKPSPIHNDTDGTRNDMGAFGGSGLIAFPLSDTLDYGPAAAGDIYYLDFVNARNEPVTLQSIGFSDPANFTCGRSFPVTINPLDSIRIPVKFLAKTTGDFQAELTVTSSNFYGTTAIKFRIKGFSGTYGELKGTLTKANSPYIITGDITIPANDSLTLSPGVELLFSGHFKMNVYGQLKAMGSEADSIYFKTMHPDSLWGGIRIMESPKNNQLRYVQLSNASKPNGASHVYDNYGAVSCRNSKLLVEHSKFTANTNTYCAGISAYYSPIVVRNTLFYNNSADFYGMICSTNSNALVDEVIFHANTGGIIQAGNSNVVLSNCLIRENKETSWGQINLDNSHCVISNCIIYKNIEWRPVCRLYSSNLQILNTIIWENGNDLFDIGSQSDLNVCCSNIQGGYDGIGNINVNPGFVNAAAGDFHLAGGSPCINKGFPSSLYNDLNGTRNDLGFYGGNGLVASPPVIDFGSAGKGQTRNITLKLYNLRETKVNLSSAVITDKKNFNLGNASPRSINSNTADSLRVEVNPTETGQLKAHIILQSPDLINSDTTIVNVLVNAGYWQGEVSGVWTKQNSPYILGGSVTVPAGKSLTIESGVLVQVDTNYAGSEAEFIISGTLQADGEETDPVSFSTIQQGSGLWKGIVLEGTGTFNHCLIENATNGIEAKTRNVTISQCEIRNNTLNGVYWNGEDRWVEGTIINSTIYSNGEYGIFCYASTMENSASATPVIRGNLIRNNIQGGVHIMAEGYTPSEGYVSRSASASPGLFGNFIKNNTGPGVKIEAYGDFAEGIPFDLKRYGYANPQLINNIVSENNKALDVFESSLNASTDIVMTNNTLWNNGTVAVYVDRGSVDISNAVIWGNQSESIQRVNDAVIGISYSNLKTPIAGDHIISKDPLLTSPASEDFGIPCTSPCVNAGNPETDTTGFSSDYYGNQRIYAGIIDIGAAENRELPQIIQVPSSLNFCAGKKAEIKIIAEGEGLEYSWFKTESGSPIGEDSVLVFDPVIPENSGDYYCIINNQCNVPIHSDTIELSVAELAIPIASFDYIINGREISLNNTSEMATDFVWHFGDGQGSTAEDPQHSYADNDEYTVVLIASNVCGSDQDSAQVNIMTSLDELINGALRLYPNPASDFVYLEFADPGTEIRTIKIAGLDGKYIKNYNPTEQGGINKIKLYGLPKGTYILLIDTNMGSYRGQMIIQ